MRARSPYQRDLTPTSKRIHELMDEEDARYTKATPPAEPPMRGYHVPMLRSISVREKYARAALDRLAKSLPTTTNVHDDLVYNQVHEILHPKSAAPAKKKFDKRWYHFYNRQVYSIGQDVVPSSAEPAPLLRQVSSRPPRVVLDTVSDTHSILSSDDQSDAPNSDLSTAAEETEASAPDMTTCPRNVYHACFDVDWPVSGVDKVVKDAVERQRIGALLRSHARILYHLFRYHASLQGGSDREPFKLAAKAKILEDLSVPLPEPARHGINDQPTSRPGFLLFLVQVALGYFKRDEVAGLVKRLAKEGLEDSTSVYYLLHDFILPFASIDDPAHFYKLFFKHESAQQVFAVHQIGLEMVFLQHATQVTHDATTSKSPSPTPQSSQPFMKFQSYLGFLNHFKIIDTKLSETQASVIFCSCLPVWPDDRAVVSQCLDYASFTLALTKIAFAKHEKTICGGEADVCPSRPASERCKCVFAAVQDKYNMLAFLEPLGVLIGKITSPGSRRAVRRRSMLDTDSTKA
ncbi:hypothetical protein SPRG_13244 [Saprolegnia parasitica CBS 223.65]|uniref:Uncharacterized protein n=1 Tax=Saprolegnia parasitica (strain CBS 223.65) TaxID=695850 RepID=A0A067BQK8_SAPPC|nr:hypothetical protein SPRG_13244 [Saprolegnia parasitica CBS 223.65]KDO20548.1 hypothetical protein SPRG_13244 [Saprolegnia parasitica CBS 223.65]|eukprot:XP_012208738.1 hypothetical protein SPRG_13244 [Saprolegnia parasitica CBS 223.65]